MVRVSQTIIFRTKVRLPPIARIVPISGMRSVTEMTRVFMMILNINLRMVDLPEPDATVQLRLGTIWKKNSSLRYIGFNKDAVDENFRIEVFS